MNTPTPRTLSIVLTWNAQDFVADCLRSLQNGSMPTDILVVDNDSADDTRQLLTEQFPDIEVINTGANLGYAGGNNVGLQLAADRGYSYAFIINPDAYIHPDSLQLLIDRMEAEPQLALASPMIYHDEAKTIWFAGSTISWYSGETRQLGDHQPDTGQYDAQRYTERANGCAMAVRMAAMERVGYMDDRFFLYYEEADWSVSFAKQGYRIGFVPAAHAVHQASSSTGGKFSPIYLYYMTRNRLLFVQKHRWYLLPSAWIFSLYTSLMRLAGIVRSTDTPTSRRAVGAIVRGYRDYCLQRFGKRH